MNLTDQQILSFVKKIKLSADKASDYKGQIDLLKDSVTKAINGMEGTKVERVRRAGSWRKGTALSPRGGSPLDIDMVFFISVDEKKLFDSEELRQEIIDVLIRAYPNKSKEDFTEGKKTVGVVFKGSGLEVDIVPFVPERKGSTYGNQPHKKLNSGTFKTSVDKQLSYIAGIKGKWPLFAPSVRMVKWWRNRKELELPSFAVELIFAHLVEIGRIKTDSNIENALIEFFAFVRANPKMRIAFPAAIGRMSDGAPYLADPTNNENNVLDNFIYEEEREEEGEWSDIIKEAEQAFEMLSHAACIGGITDTVGKWREIFESFTIQES